MRYQEEPLSHCENIILEAKRVLLYEQLDRIANVTLAENDITSDKDYNKNNYNENIAHFCTETFVAPEGDDSNELLNLANSEGVLKVMPYNLARNKAILKRFFCKWKNMIQIEKSRVQLQAEKLNDFITNLKNHQGKTSSNSAISRENSKPISCFKNRYKTQKTIIDMQQSKIEEQTKIINELKLGIIREDLLKSIENTKIEIREIFSACSEKLFSKAPLFKALEDREKIMICSQKAPKMVQKMQQRATERARYREIILERKRLIEEARQKLLEEAIEKKRVLEEDERKRNLEIINEQRKRELHLRKLRQEKRQKYEKKLLKAHNFHNNLLISQCFRKLSNYYLKSKENSTLAIEHNLRKLKSGAFKVWQGHIERKYKVKYDIATGHFEFKALSGAFNKLKECKLQSVRSLQVAEDVYDFRLTSNTFIHWHRFVCKQIMLEDKKIQIALKHHNRKLLFQYFYQWKSLPVVLQLEAAKEEKKRKWREKVWEILPDYRPPERI